MYSNFKDGVLSGFVYADHSSELYSLQGHLSAKDLATLYGTTIASPKIFKGAFAEIHKEVQRRATPTRLQQIKLFRDRRMKNSKPAAFPGAIPAVTFAIMSDVEIIRAPGTYHSKKLRTGKIEWSYINYGFGAEHSVPCAIVINKSTRIVNFDGLLRSQIILDEMSANEESEALTIPVTIYGYKSGCSISSEQVKQMFVDFNNPGTKVPAKMLAERVGDSHFATLADSILSDPAMHLPPLMASSKKGRPPKSGVYTVVDKRSVMIMARVTIDGICPKKKITYLYDGSNIDDSKIRTLSYKFMLFFAEVRRLMGDRMFFNTSDNMHFSKYALNGLGQFFFTLGKPFIDLSEGEIRSYAKKYAEIEWHKSGEFNKFISTDRSRPGVGAKPAMQEVNACVYIASEMT